EELAVIGGLGGIERARDRLHRRARLDQARRDDHDELGVVLLEARRLEQRTEDRDVAEPGQLLLAEIGLVLQQARDRKALPVAQLDRGVEISGRKDRVAAIGHAVEATDLGGQMDLDAITVEDDGGEDQLYAEILVVERNRVALLVVGADGNLATGEKTGGDAGQG